MTQQTVSIQTPFIRLDALLKLAGAVPTGGQAKLWIQSGRVKVNQEICTQRGKKMHPGDTVQIPEMDCEIVLS